MEQPKNMTNEQFAFYMSWIIHKAYSQATFEMAKEILKWLEKNKTI